MLATALVSVADRFLHAETLEVALADVTVRAQRLLSEATGGTVECSISRFKRGVYTTVAATSDAPMQLDLVQYTAKEGPCVQAAHGDGVVVTGDLVHDARWPRLALALRGEAPPSLRSVLSHPLTVHPSADRDSLESLNTYATRASAFGSGHHRLAAVFCSQVATLASLYRLAHASMETVENLREAIDSRDIIGQAKGILMERHRITAEAAFDMLRVASQRSNRKLRDVAERLAFTGALPQGDGGQPLEPRPDTAL